MSVDLDIAAAIRRGDPWFAGTLTAVPFAELFQVVSSTHRSGELSLALLGRRPRHVEIAFREGQVVFATSDAPDERLGAVLLRLGRASEDVLASAAPHVAAGRFLGQVLVDAGALTPDALYDALVEQVRSIVLGVFGEDSGGFSFRSNVARRGNSVKLPERSRELLVEGLRRAGLLPHGDATAPAMVSPAERHEAPVDVYRMALKRIFFRMRQATPNAAERLNSRFARIGAADRTLFDGVAFDHEGNLDTGRVLVNVLASGQEGPMARARALAALDGLLSFALFEARNVLPRADSDALWAEIDQLKGRGDA